MTPRTDRAARPPAPPAGADAQPADAPSRLDDDDLRRLLLIRHVERALLDLFAAGAVAGTTHTCLGQEYVPVALRPLLADDDFVLSNHRGHGHYLARFDDPHSLLAEILGREGGVCNGVGGSQHLLRGRYLSSGVQGQSLPVAVGTALHLKRTGRNLLSCVFVGDGTWGEGAVYEALNMAALWGLPLLVVVENNGIAQSTPTAAHLAGSIGDRARAFGLTHLRTASDDVNRLRALLAPLTAAVRSGQPSVVEIVTRRLGPHSKGDDIRDPATLRELSRRDWYHRYAAAHPEQFAALDAAQRAHVEAVVREVEGRPLASGAPA